MTINDRIRVTVQGFAFGREGVIAAGNGEDAYNVRLDGDGPSIVYYFRASELEPVSDPRDAEIARLRRSLAAETRRADKAEACLRGLKTRLAQLAGIYVDSTTDPL